MIIFSNDTLHKTIIHLEKNYPTNEKVYLHIAEGFDSIEGPDGQMGFGCYVPADKTIYLAGEMPEEVPEKDTAILETLAHEYKHFLQDCEEKPFDEEEAENFAQKVIKDMEREGTANGND